MTDETQELGIPDMPERYERTSLEIPPEPLEGKDRYDSEPLVEFSRSPIVQLTIWAEIEIGRIAATQIKMNIGEEYKDERMAQEDESFFPLLTSGEISSETLEGDIKMSRWFHHRVERAEMEVYNKTFPKIGTNEDQGVALEKIFDWKWDRQFRDRRIPIYAKDSLEKTSDGEPLGDPVERPKPPEWLGQK